MRYGVANQIQLTQKRKKEEKATILISNLPANGAFFQNPYHAHTYGLQATATVFSAFCSHNISIIPSLLSASLHIL